jgi:hypothetical protein
MSRFMFQGGRILWMQIAFGIMWIHPNECWALSADA